MKSFFALLALAASAAAQFTINTPSGATGAIQCQVYQVSWVGGTGPFDLRLLDASQTLVEELGTAIPASPFQWTVNEPSGQQFGFTLIDSQGNTALSGSFIVQPSSNSACLSASASTPGASTPAASSASAPVASGSSTAAGTSPTISAPGSSPSSAGSSPSASKVAGSSAAASASKASGSVSPSTSATASSAMNVVANTGFLGAAVAFAAALF